MNNYVIATTADSDKLKTPGDIYNIDPKPKPSEEDQVFHEKRIKFAI